MKILKFPIQKARNKSSVNDYLDSVEAYHRSKTDEERAHDQKRVDDYLERCRIFWKDKGFQP